MATMALENINPYSKLGLHRKPTYEEIANLISENEKLTGNLQIEMLHFSKQAPRVVILMD